MAIKLKGQELHDICLIDFSVWKFDEKNTFCIFWGETGDPSVLFYHSKKYTRYRRKRTNFPPPANFPPP